jgi:hypothetical protein
MGWGESNGADAFAWDFAFGAGESKLIGGLQRQLPQGFAPAGGSARFQNGNLALYG